MKKIAIATLTVLLLSICPPITDPVSAASGKLKASKASRPSKTMFTGQGFPIKGIVSSKKSIQTLTVGVYNSKGKRVAGRTVKPKKKTYDLKRLDSKITFKKLKPGTYTYKVIARDASMKKEKTLISRKFTVHNKKVSLISSTFPVDINRGKNFKLKGKLLSQTRITSVTVKVIDSKKKVRLKKTVKPNKKSYSLAKISKQLNFKKLKNGNYTIVVEAKDGSSKKKRTVGKQRFKVATASTLSAKVNNVPAKIKVTNAATVRGQLTSNYTISKATVGVYDKNGKRIAGRTYTVNKKSLAIDTQGVINFQTLPLGNYTFRILATDARFNKSKTVVNRAFTIYTDSTLAVKGHNVPPNIAVGNYFPIHGTITSNYPIQKVTVGVYNSSGKLVTGKTETPAKKSYAIASADSATSFGQLAIGNYRYRVTAEDSFSGSRRLIDQPFSVVKVAYSSPVKGYSVGSLYGCNCSIHNGKHNGIDYPTQGARPNIEAVHSGTVTIASTCPNDYAKSVNCPCGKCGNMGNCIIITDSKTGIQTKYMHLSSFAKNPATGKTFKTGDTVKAGTIIGKVGTTGRSTGTHLHLEFRAYENKSWVLKNPVSYISYSK